tara:strand:- start:189 stop:1133 length:945 start_codon:yes stop_codon:yes gene_type:complete
MESSKTTNNLVKNLADNYTKNHKKLIIIPILLILMAFIILANSHSKTGEYVQRDVSLKGGITLTIYTNQEINEKLLEETLKTKFEDVIVRELSEFGTDQQIGLVIETSSQQETEIKKAIEDSINIKLTQENLSIEVVGSSLGESFYRQMSKSLLFAFLFMAIIIFLIFRTFIPSLAVVLAAFSDIIITIAVINVMNIRISSSGIAALLLLIGYSIDTDILMTTRVLKRKGGTIMEGIFSSMKTGLTMTLTTLIALTIAFFLSKSLVLKNMFLIINIGLITDILITYLMNAPILIMYSEKKEKVKVYNQKEKTKE